MNKYDREYYERQIKTLLALQALYDDAYKKIIAGMPLSKLTPDEYFAFEKYPDAAKSFNEAVKKLDADVIKHINDSTRKAWDIANRKNTDFVTSQFAQRDQKPPPDALKTNIADYEKFANREIGGLNLSARVWKINGTDFKKQIELAVSAAIKEGKSAAELSRDIRKYLNNPDALFRRVRDSDGNLQLSKAARDYHPGQGVYRSAYKNAMRLARTEINMAYRESDYLRWKQNDSIIGFKIQNSNRHWTVCEVCKRFDGLMFPKTFHWLGFHVQCMCTAIAVLASDAEVAAWERGEEINPELPKMPEEFVKYQDELSTKGKKEVLKEYQNGGLIEVYKDVERTASDYKRIYECCNFFAKQGEKTVITPSIHYKDPLYKAIYRELIGTKYERKCPDFKVGDNFYEHEGFDSNKNTNPIRTFGNMISRGIIQSDRIVIEDCGVGRVWAQRNIYGRVENGGDIKEVWIFEDNNELTRLF